jgi:hypothetical protein
VSASPIQNEILDELDRRSSGIHIIFLIGIIVIGFILRFYGFYAGQGYHYFAINDELSAYEYALSFLAGDEKARYLGQPSFAGGQAPGPIWTIFWVLLLKLGGNSVDDAIFWMVVLNTFTIYLVYLVASKFLNSRYALTTTLIFATAPWPIYYSVGVWNPIPLAFWGGLLFLSLWAVANQHYSRRIFWVCLIAAIIPQIHMVGVFYILAILLILFLIPTRLNKQWFVAGLIAGATVYVPYIIGEIYHDWENIRNILGKGTDSSFGVLKIITAPVTVLSSVPARWTEGGFAELKHFGNTYFGSYFVLVFFSLVSFVNAVVYLASFLSSLFRSLKGKWLSPREVYESNPVFSFIGILIAVPILLFSLSGQNYATRYTIIIFPLMFLLPVLFLKNIKNARTKRIWIGNIASVTVFNVFLVISFFTYQNGLIEESNNFLASFRKLEMLRQKLRSDAGDGAFIKVHIADDVNALPEKSRKTKAAIPHYMAIHQQFISHTTSSRQTKVYLLKLAENLKEREKGVVYKGNGIAIVAVDSGR